MMVELYKNVCVSFCMSVFCFPSAKLRLDSQSATWGPDAEQEGGKRDVRQYSAVARKCSVGASECSVENRLLSASRQISAAPKDI